MRIKDVTPQTLAAFIKKEGFDFKRDNAHNISRTFVKKMFSNPNKSQLCSVQRKLDCNFREISNLLKSKLVGDSVECETKKENHFEIKRESQFDTAQNETTEDSKNEKDDLQDETSEDLENETSEDSQNETSEDSQNETNEESQNETSEESQNETSDESQNETSEDDSQNETSEESQIDTAGEIYRKIEEFPKKFDITIPNSEAYAYPRCTRGHFSISIQNLIYAEFNKVNYACPLRFVRKRLKRDGKCTSNYFSAECLFSTCCKYKIQQKEKNKYETVFSVNQLGKLLHLKGEEKRRPLTRDLRRNWEVKDLKKDIEKYWADKSKAKQISAGNLSGIPTYNTLRSIKAVNKKRDQLDDRDPLKELHLVQKGLRTKMQIENTEEVCKKLNSLNLM